MAPHLKGLLLSGAGMLVISPDGMLVKMVHEAGAFQIVFWRTLFAGLVLSLLLVIRHRGRVVGTIRGLGRVGLLASLMMGLSNISFVMAMTMTSVANTLVVLATLPLFGAVLGLVLIGERVRPRTWAAIAMAIGGVVILLAGSVGGSGRGLGDGTLSGDLMALAIPLFMGLALVLLRKAGDRDTVPVVALGALISAALAWPWCGSLAVTAHDMAVIVVMGCLVTPLALSLYTSGARYIPAAEVGLLALVETVLGPVWAWVGVGEVPTVLTLVGGGLVVVAITGNSVLALMRRGGRADPRLDPPQDPEIAPLPPG